MLVTDVEPFECRRGRWCDDRRPVRDSATGHHVGWRGALLHQVDGLCAVCRGKVLSAVASLPLDVADLTTALGRGGGGGHSGGGIRTQKPGPTLPLREHPHTLRALIDHETCAWAQAVARAGCGARWDARQRAHSRQGHRVASACALLVEHSSALLALGATECRARSLAVRRDVGHDPDRVTRYGDDYWTTRDGVEGAVVLLRLHQLAWCLVGRDTAPLPVFARCPACRRLALRRWPGEGDAHCQHCGHTASERHLDVLRTAAANCRTAQDVAVLTAALTRPTMAMAS